MDEKRKQAYRYLLYRAMVYGKMQNKANISFNPFEIKRNLKFIENIGTLDCWLHNLAYYNYTGEWDKFSEDIFWSEYESWLERNPQLYLKNFKEIFEKELEQLSK